MQQTTIRHVKEYGKIVNKSSDKLRRKKIVYKYNVTINKNRLTYKLNIKWTFVAPIIHFQCKNTIRRNNYLFVQ